MKLVDEQTMRQLDARTIAETALRGSDLMQRAGEGVADALIRLAQLHHIEQPTVLFLRGAEIMEEMRLLPHVYCRIRAGGVLSDRGPTREIKSGGARRV